MLLFFVVIFTYRVEVNCVYNIKDGQILQGKNKYKLNHLIYNFMYKMFFYFLQIGI